MKKFVVFFLLCSFLFGASLFGKSFDFSKFDNLKVQVFTSTKNEKRIDGVGYVDNGQGQILLCDYKNYEVVCKTNNNISGVTFIFDGDEKLFNSVTNDLGVRFVEKSQNSFVGYSGKFDGGTNYAGKKVNVQGYYSNGKIYIGTPLLLGSY